MEKVSEIMNLGSKQLGFAILEVRLGKRWPLFSLPQWQEAVVPQLIGHDWMPMQNVDPQGKMFIIERPEVSSRSICIISDQQWLFLWLPGSLPQLPIADACNFIGILRDQCKSNKVLSIPSIERWGLRTWWGYPDASPVDSQEFLRHLMVNTVISRGLIPQGLSFSVERAPMRGTLNMAYGQLTTQTIMANGVISQLVGQQTLLTGFIIDADAGRFNTSVDIEEPKHLFQDVMWIISLLEDMESD